MPFISVNTYESITNPKIISSIPVKTWFDLIKSSEHSDTITDARHGKIDYDKTKAQLPCVTYNFLYDSFKKDSNIISSTGLLYIDIDNPLFDINNLDTSKIFASYRSFGGCGYAIIIKVDNLTSDNFKSSYEHIINNIGVLDFVDKQAIKHSQFNVLSFDPNIFINDNCTVYNANDFATPPNVIRKKEEAYTQGRVANNIRFDNLNEIYIPESNDFVVNWDGYQYIKCFIPMKKIQVNRNKFLLSYCNNFVILNPNFTKESTLEILRSVNQYACAEPVNEMHLKRVVDSIFKYKENGTLEPIYFWKLRKFVFNPDSNLSVNFPKNQTV